MTYFKNKEYILKKVNVLNNPSNYCDGNNN